MDPYDNLDEPRGDMPPFSSESPVSGEPVIRITVAVPSRNAIMDLRTRFGMEIVAKSVYDALTHLSGYGMLPHHGRYVQVDIEGKMLERVCADPRNRRR